MFRIGKGLKNKSWQSFFKKKAKQQELEDAKKCPYKVENPKDV